MSNPRKLFRLFVLAAIGISLCACHFHRHGCRSSFYRPAVRICR